MAAGFAAVLAGCGRWGYEEDPLCDTGALCAPADPDSGSASDTDPAAPDALSSGTPDAAAAVPGTPDCGSLQLVAETFDGGALHQNWVGIWRGAGNARIVDNRATLTLGAGTGDAEARYYATSSADFRNSEIAVEVPHIGGRVTALELRDGQGIDRLMNFIGASRGIAIAVEGGQLKAQVLDGNGATTVDRVAYDAAAHRHWRLREADGVVTWETSPDRATWTSLHRQSVVLDTAAVYPLFAIRGQVATATEAAFDNVNVAAPDVPGPCLADTLRDGFDDGVIAPQWRPWNGAGQCSLREINGRAELNFPGDASACTLVSTRFYDIGASAFVYDLYAVPAELQFQTLVELRGAIAPVRDERIEVRIHGTFAVVTAFAGGAQVAQLHGTFDRTDHRFGRLHGAHGRLSYDTSPDGTTWSTRFETANRLAAGAVHFAITGIHSGGGPPLQLQIGGVNAR